MALLLSNNDFFRLSNDDKLLLVMQEPVNPVNPVNPTPSAFDPNAIAIRAKALIQRFGIQVEVQTANDLSSNPYESEKTSDVYSVFVVKDELDPENTIQFIEKKVMAKFLMSRPQDREVQIGDSFMFQGVNHTISHFNSIAPNGITIIYEVYTQ